MMPPEELPLRAGLCVARLASRGPAPPAARPLLQAPALSGEAALRGHHRLALARPRRQRPLDCAFQMVGRR